MSNPTTPFGWQMPTNTDLVTDLPADFEVFGQAVATSMQDLLGGTTGQLLSKTSNTDMDFTWTTPNPGDITGVTAGIGISGGGTSGDVTVTNSMATAIDAKGDLIVGTGADAFSRLAVGATNGHVLTVDSAQATGLKYAAAAAGSITLTQLGTGNLSGTSTSITGITQDFLLLYINNPKWTTASGTMDITFNSDTGANYNLITLQYQPNIDTYSGTGNTSFYLMPNNGLNTANGRQFWITIPNAKSAGFHSWLMFGNTVNVSSTQMGIGGSGIYTNAAAITSIQIRQADGYTFNAGTYTLWGG